MRGWRVKKIKHGVSAYRNNICRCDICRTEGRLDAKRRRDAARVEYKKSAPVEKKKMRLSDVYHDTLTREQYMRLRGRQ